MIFTETKLKGSFIIELEKSEDQRGFFLRIWDKEIFEKHGLISNLVQSNISFNKKKGTMRGLHYQKYPYEESKMVMCTKGRIYDVIVDIRTNSKSRFMWTGIELTDKNCKMLYVPPGFAHGFQTLENNTEVFYHVSQFYMPEYESGLRWDDPVINILWPLKSIVISKKDSSWKLIENEG